MHRTGRIRFAVINGIFVGTPREVEAEAHTTHGSYFQDRSSESIHHCDYILGQAGVLKTATAKLTFRTAENRRSCQQRLRAKNSQCMCFLLKECIAARRECPDCRTAEVKNAAAYGQSTQRPSRSYYILFSRLRLCRSATYLSDHRSNTIRALHGSMNHRSLPSLSVLDHWSPYIYLVPQTRGRDTSSRIQINQLAFDFTC